MPVKKRATENGNKAINSKDQMNGAPILICPMSDVINKGRVKNIFKIDKRIIEINPSTQLKRLFINQILSLLRKRNKKYIH